MAADSGPPAGDDRRYYDLVERTVDVALAAAPVPLRVLDVECRTGDVLRELIERVPYGAEYVGVDGSDEAVRIARAESDGRLAFVCADPEALPFPDAHFDLVVSALGFDRWRNPAAVMDQMARVLTDTGRLVVVEATAHKQVAELIAQTGLRVERRETVRRTAGLVASVRAYVAGP
jgi:ubiquinone/menaquinone biosynthesis C-methylase UbiE